MSLTNKDRKRKGELMNGRKYFYHLSAFSAQQKEFYAALLQEEIEQQRWYVVQLISEQEKLLCIQ